MTFGNYDAGQSRPISNPLFNNGVRKAEAGKTEFNFGFKAGNVEGTKAPWEITRTTVTPEKRIETATAENVGTLASFAERAEYDRQVDEMLNPYITPETRERIASTSFNAAMMLGGFEDAYKLLSA